MDLPKKGTDSCLLQPLKHKTAFMNTCCSNGNLLCSLAQVIESYKLVAVKLFPTATPFVMIAIDDKGTNVLLKYSLFTLSSF